MKTEKCVRCGTIFGMSDEIYTVAMERKEQFSFYCPYGHGQHFVTGESELTKITRERDRLKQDAARLEEGIQRQRQAREAAERSAKGYKAAATRLKNRAAAGVCPCCNRTFFDLARHMAAKHSQADLTNVVELGQTAVKA